MDYGRDELEGKERLDGVEPTVLESLEKRKERNADI